MKNKEVEMKLFGIKNNTGFIPAGSKVYFEVENQDMWGGDNFGILKYNFENKEYFIETKRSGNITIGKGYDAYINTIEII